MESASFESTSTTDCMSDSGSVLYSENSNYGNVDIDDDVSFVNAHIGEIDEGAPLRVLASNHQANIRYAGEQQEGSTRAANSYSDDSDEDNAINNSHDDDDSSIMYDSVMEEIRKDIWEQVRQAKLKVRFELISVVPTVSERCITFFGDLNIQLLSSFDRRKIRREQFNNKKIKADQMAAEVPVLPYPTILKETQLGEGWIPLPRMKLTLLSRRSLLATTMMIPAIKLRNQKLRFSA